MWSHSLAAIQYKVLTSPNSHEGRFYFSDALWVCCCLAWADRKHIWLWCWKYDGGTVCEQLFKVNQKKHLKTKLADRQTFPSKIKMFTFWVLLLFIQRNDLINIYVLLLHWNNLLFLTWEPRQREGIYSLCGRDLPSVNQDCNLMRFISLQLLLHSQVALVLNGLFFPFFYLTLKLQSFSLDADW